MAVTCSNCFGADYVTAPPENAWRRYFAKIGMPWQHVLVPCPACGGVSGRANRAALMARLAARKTAFVPLDQESTNV